MDFGTTFSPTRCSRRSAPSAIVVCLAAIGLNVHFGYTGLLNFGQAGFMAVAGYAIASMVATWDLTSGSGILVGIVLLSSCSRCCSVSRRCDCEPTTSRS